MRLNIFETDTETFFRDQNFRDQDRYSRKIEKSLDTEKSRDEISHSAVAIGGNKIWMIFLLMGTVVGDEVAVNKENIRKIPRNRNTVRDGGITAMGG